MADRKAVPVPRRRQALLLPCRQLAADLDGGVAAADIQLWCCLPQMSLQETNSPGSGQVSWALIPLVAKPLPAYSSSAASHVLGQTNNPGVGSAVHCEPHHTAEPLVILSLKGGLFHAAKHVSGVAATVYSPSLPHQKDVHSLSVCELCCSKAVSHQDVCGEGAIAAAHLHDPQRLATPVPCVPVQDELADRRAVDWREQLAGRDPRYLRH